MFIEILFKMLLFKGGVLIYAEHCIYVVILKKDCAIDQLKPGLKSKINGTIFVTLFTELWAGPQCAFTLLITYTGANKHAKYEKIKGLQCKRLLLFMQHKYKNAYWS